MTRRNRSLHAVTAGLGRPVRRSSQQLPVVFRGLPFRYFPHFGAGLDRFPHVSPPSPRQSPRRDATAADAVHRCPSSASPWRCARRSGRDGDGEDVTSLLCPYHQLVSYPTKEAGRLSERSSKKPLSCFESKSFQLISLKSTASAANGFLRTDRRYFRAVSS